MTLWEVPFFFSKKNFSVSSLGRWTGNVGGGQGEAVSTDKSVLVSLPYAFIHSYLPLFLIVEHRSMCSGKWCPSLKEKDSFLGNGYLPEAP